LTRSTFFRDRSSVQASPPLAAPAASRPKSDAGILYNLHLLRVIAALGVVYFHLTSTAGLNLRWDVGSRGVDVFFVISGFIITFIGTSKADEFFRRRLIRVVPFYWAATLVVFAAATVAPRLFRSTTPDVTHLLYSLFFIPHENVAIGEMMPTLLLGWSLNFEMFFYVLFSLALLVSQRWSPLICLGAIVTFVLAVHGLGIDNPILDFYGRPIVLEFCYGVVVFYAFQWFSDRKEAFAKYGAFKWFLAFVMVGGLVALNVLEKLYRDQIPRYLIAGIPAFFIALSALLLERLYGFTTKNRTIYLLGESSYITYLVHPYIVFAAIRLFVKHAGTLSLPVVLVLIVGLLVLTHAIAVAIHVWFEKPVMRVLRAKLL
jgi:exopolysaccharide production protein ExoZ